MARNRVNRDAPLMTTRQAAAVASEARRAHVVTLAEQRRRYNFIEARLALDTPHRLLVEECRKRFKMSAPAVERVKTRIMRSWAHADLQLRDVRRTQARRRIQSIVLRALRSGDLKAALRGEELLARIDGLFDSTRVRLEVDSEFGRQMSAADAVFRNLTQDQVADILAEQHATEDAAQRWRDHVKANGAS